MQEKLKELRKSIIKFAKKNKMSCICFLLATLVALSGAASLAKYISGAPVKDGSLAASFHCSSAVTGVSALSFTNTDFWGGDSDKKIAMNSLRSIDFSASNFEYDSEGNQLVSDVRMAYELSFSAPKAFAENLAFQVLDDKDHAITTQMIMSHFIGSLEADHEKHPSKGDAQFGGIDFVDANGNTVDLIFDITHYTDDDNKVHAVCEATHPEHGCEYGGEKLIITVDEVVETLEQTLMFRAWDTSGMKLPSISDEGGELQPPLRAVISTEVPMYRIRIFMDKHFILEPGVPETDDFIITIAPTKALHDDHLGAFIQQKDASGNYFSPESLSAGADVYFASITETIYESTTNLGFNGNWGNAVDEYHVASMKVHNPGSIVEDDETKSNTFSKSVNSTRDVSGLSDFADSEEVAEEAYTYGSSSDYLYLDAGFAIVAEAAATYRVAGTITKRTYYSYADSAVGTETMSGACTVTKTVEQSSGDNYIVKVFRDYSGTANLSFSGTVDCYLVTEYTFSISEFRRKWGENWSRNDSSYTDDQKNAIFESIKNGNDTYKGSSVKDETRTKTYTESDTTTLTDETSYQLFVRERVSEEANHATIKQLSQMVYNSDGSVGTIYFDGADSLKDKYTVVDGEIIYTERHLDALEFFGPNPDDPSQTIQTLFLSTCYSKDYPIAVRVIFEQIQ